jgi:ABC-type branched-subunit amino acid transport system substrate-binding protein
MEREEQKVNSNKSLWRGFTPWIERRRTVLRALVPVAAASAVAVGSLAAGVGTSTASAAAAHHKKASATRWVLGSLIDVTGEDAAGGAAQKAGITYYINQVNKAGGVDGHKLSLKFCDTQSIPTAAATCAQQLANVNTHIVLAQSIDPPTRGALPYLGKDLVLAVDPVLAPPSSDKNVYQATGSGQVVASALVKAVKSAGLSKIGILYTTDTSGTNQFQAAQSVAQAAGLTVVSQSQVDGATDVTPQLVQLRSEGAQVIYLASVGTNSATAVNSYTTLGMTQPLVLGAADVTDGFLQSLSKIPKNMYGVSQLLQDDTGLKPGTVKVFDAYLKNFKAATHEPADTQTTSAVYDGCEAADAMKSAGINLSKLEKYLTTHQITCLGSDMRFDTPGVNVINGQPASLAKAGSTAKAGWGPVTGKL